MEIKVCKTYVSYGMPFNLTIRILEGKIKEQNVFYEFHQLIRLVCFPEIPVHFFFPTNQYLPPP